jgi:carboxylesterase type B
MKNLIILIGLLAVLPLAQANYQKITVWGHVAGAATILNSYAMDPLSNGTPSAIGVSHRICMDIGRLSGRVDDLYNRNTSDVTAKRINGLANQLERKCMNDEKKDSFTAEEVSEIQKTAEEIIELVYGRKQ